MELTHIYECIYIIDAQLEEDAINAIVEKFSGLISENGTIVKVDQWGKRRLAYPINDLTEGFYVLVEFESPASLPAELERVFKITDGILRSLIVRKDIK